MHKKMVASAVLSLGFPLCSIAAEPSVAVDIAPLHSLVSQVMEGVNKPDLLIPAEASPHQYTLRPSQARALSEAQIVFWIGEEFTPWLEKAMDNVASSAQKVEMLELKSTTTYEFREGATFEPHAHHGEEGHHGEERHDNNENHKEKSNHHDKHDDHHDKHEEKHEHQDDHDEHDEHEVGKTEHHDEHDHHGIDPHAWLDPQNAKAWITDIKEVLSKNDPENAKTYEQNAKKAIASLDKLIDTTRNEVNKLGDLKFIVFHDAYQYFENRFNISAAGSISLGDAEDPSPARITEIRETVKKLGVTCVFTEPQYNPGLVHSVFEGTKISAIGVMDPLGASIQPGNQHYSSLIQGMVKSLSNCM